MECTRSRRRFDLVSGGGRRRRRRGSGSLPAADPIVGLVIAGAIGVVLVVAARDVFGRLLDCIDPEYVDTARTVLSSQPGVRGSPTVADAVGRASARGRH